MRVIERRDIHRAWAAVVAIPFTFGLASCAPSAPPPTVTAGDYTLRVGTLSDVVNYNPLVGNSRTDYWVTNLMYPHLLSVSPDGSKVPELATKWGYTNPTTGYYEIRSDMKWSDGTPLTADDVAWTLNAVKRDKPAGTISGQLTSLDTATAVSATRVEVTLTKPDASFVDEVGFWGNIVPKHVFSTAASVATFANDGTNGGWVSAGPYRLTQVQRGQNYTLERVPNYPLVSGGKPLSARIIYRVFPDVNTEILALKSGELDLIANALPPAQVGPLKSTPGVNVTEVPGLGYAHMTYNMKQPDLAKLLVRQALTQAVDYQTIRNVVLQGQGRGTGSTPIPPVLKDYFDPASKEYTFDVSRARTLMEQAGYTAGSDGLFPVSFRLIYQMSDPVTSQWATLVHDWAAKAGINIVLQGSERNTYLAKAAKGDFDIMAGNFAIMDDPTTNMVLTYLPGGAINYTYCDDPKLNALIEQGKETSDTTQRVKLMREAAQIVRDNVYDNVLYSQNLFFASNNKWTGFQVKPSELLSVVNTISLANAHPVS